MPAGVAILLVTGVVASLCWLGHPPAGTETGTVTRGPDSPAAPAADGRVLNPAPYDATRGCWTFDIPLQDIPRERLAALRGVLMPGCPQTNASVQVIAECDHHGSFAWAFPLQDPRLTRLPFRTGFRDAAPGWRAVDHPASWSAWETVALRKLQVKYFTASNLVPPSLRIGLDLLPPSTGAVRLTWILPLADPVRQGDRAEIAFDVSGWTDNPFGIHTRKCGVPDLQCADSRSRALGLSVTWTSPSGVATSLTPFLHQEFAAAIEPDGEHIRPLGAKHWRFRFRPVETGLNAYAVWHTDASGTRHELARGALHVRPGQPDRNIRISPRNPRYFEDGEGRFFYPFGWNIPYPVDRPYWVDYVPYLPTENSLAVTRRMLDDLADCGGNFIRFWVSDWWNGIEWNASVDNYGGLGRYNLKNAWLTDQILDHCERRGIRVLFTTMNHVRLSHGYSWGRNPFGVQNGGFLHYPEQFWIDPRMPPYSRNRLAYLVARYADSPAVFSWDFMSEVDLVTGRMWPQATRFIADQLLFMRSIDPYRHIIANHICRVPYGWDLFNRPEIEFIHSNGYPDTAGFPPEQADAIRTFSTTFSGRNKPVLVTEYAGHWAGDPTPKMRRDTLSGLWVGIASRLSGAPLSWWWNFNYGENLSPLYRVAADFMRGEDLIREDTPETGGWLDRPATPESRDGNLNVYMVGNRTRRFIYLLNFDTICRSPLLPTLCRNPALPLQDMAPGRYEAEFWDTRLGKTDIRREVAVDAAGRGRLVVPDFEFDWMVKLGPATNPPALTASDVASPAPVPVTVSEPVRGRTPPPLLWRIQALVPVTHPEAAARSLHEVTLALPRGEAGWYPAVTTTNAAPVSFDWSWLGDREGWRIRIPGTQQGPFNVIPAMVPATNLWTFRESSVGLEAETRFDRVSVLYQAEAFDRLFATNRQSVAVRLATIDQLEDPGGRATDFFVTRYRAPLLIPAAGSHTFALNSDDGSALRLNGTPLVEWLGNHDPEFQDKPLGNAWNHKGNRDLSPGLYAMELFHQEYGGYQMARVGWKPAALPAGPGSVMARPFPVPAERNWSVLPPWMLDGRIPCSVQMTVNGQPGPRLLPALGLRLRRPAREIVVLAIEQPARDPEFRFFPTGGWQSIPDQGLPAVWVTNRHAIAFSLDCEQGGEPALGNAFIKTLLYDLEAPLSLAVGPALQPVRSHRPREWVNWPLSPASAGQPFHVRLGNTVLLEGTLAGAPASEGRIPEAATFRPDAILIPTPNSTTQSMDPRALAGWLPRLPVLDPPVVGTLPFDPWTQSEQELVDLITATGSKAPVVVLMADAQVPVRGIRSDTLFTTFLRCGRAVQQIGGLPVCAISRDYPSSLDALSGPLAGLLRAQTELGCPMVDLRRWDHE